MKKLKASLLMLFAFGALTACNNDDELSIDDAALIESIVADANKTEIPADQLPALAKELIAAEYTEEFANTVKYASGLGYEVALRTQSIDNAGNSFNVYFDNSGNQLDAEKDCGGKKHGKRHGKHHGKHDGKGHGKHHGDKGKKECFAFVYPVSFTMPDASTITGNSRDEVRGAIKAWYKANANSCTVKPALVFPVSVTLKGGETKSVADKTELKALYGTCETSK